MIRAEASGESSALQLVLGRCFRIGWSCLLLCTTGIAQGSAPIKKSGKFFTVIYDGGNERIAEQALAVIEPVWPLVCQSFGSELTKPQERLEVFLYRDGSGYRVADRRLTGGKFAANQAMSHWSSKSAHVALQPPCADRHLARNGLPMQTQAMLAWEACHVSRFEVCPNFRMHPGWFHDGLAAVTAREVLQKLHPKLVNQPFYTQRWRRVRRLIESKKMISLSDLLADRAGGLDRRDCYAARIVFYEFVRRADPEALFKVAKAIRSFAASRLYSAEVNALSVRLLGPLGSDFSRTVLEHQAAWDEQARSLWIDGKEWHQTAFADASAVAFAVEPVRGGAFRAAGTVLIHEGDTQQMNFFIAKSAAGFYSLALDARKGWTLLDCHSGDNESVVLASGKAPRCKAGIDVPFVFRGRGRKLQIEIAGSSWSARLPRELPDEIVWGVGAQSSVGGVVAGASGIWRDVTVASN